MTVLVDDFYRSSNGDRWQLLRDTASGRRVVRKFVRGGFHQGWAGPRMDQPLPYRVFRMTHFRMS